MKIYITFGDEKFSKSRDFGVWAARHLGGFDKVIAYTPDDIDEKFKIAHADIFDVKRGYGLWLWKPYIIFKALTEVCSDGDTLFYGDGGSFIIRDVKHIEDAMGEEDIWVSHNPLMEWQFTKKDTFDIMDCQGEKYEHSAQAQGSFLYIRKTKATVFFIKEWLDLCCDIRLLHPDNVYSGQQNPIGFVSHREDQSILSLLCKKRGVRFHQDPSQYGKYPEKYWQKGYDHEEPDFYMEYPTCVVLHRTANMRIKTVVRQLILAIIPRWIGLKLIS